MRTADGRNWLSILSSAFETSGSATSLLVRLLVGYIIFCN